MPSVLATETDLATLDSLERIRDWCAIPAQVWQALSTFVGTLPKCSCLLAVASVFFDGGAERPADQHNRWCRKRVEACGVDPVGFSLGVVRQVFQLPDIEPLADPMPLPPQPTTSDSTSSGQSPLKKVKFSSVLDQLNVVRPAQNFIARGGRHMSAHKAADVHVPAGSKEALQKPLVSNTACMPPPAPPGEGQSRGAKRRRREKEKLAGLQASAAPSNTNVSQQPNAEHPKKWGIFYTTNCDGRELCYAFARGAPGACREPCKNGRVHACQYCRGKHTNANCTSPQASQHKDKGGKQGSGRGK